MLPTIAAQAGRPEVPFVVADEPLVAAAVDEVDEVEVPAPSVAAADEDIPTDVPETLAVEGEDVALTLPLVVALLSFPAQPTRSPSVRASVRRAG